MDPPASNRQSLGGYSSRGRRPLVLYLFTLLLPLLLPPLYLVIVLLLVFRPRRLVLLCQCSSLSPQRLRREKLRACRPCGRASMRMWVGSRWRSASWTTRLCSRAWRARTSMCARPWPWPVSLQSLIFTLPLQTFYAAHLRDSTASRPPTLPAASCLPCLLLRRLLENRPLLSAMFSFILLCSKLFSAGQCWLCSREAVYKRRPEL